MADQGCPGEGADTRFLGWLVCPIQRFLSWRSSVEPLSIVVAFPPYIAVNVPLRNHDMLLIRFGWRYDRNWKGYLFPTGAAKIRRNATGLLY